MRLDLHLHTTYSDGTYTPAELVAAAKSNGIALLAVTDHNTLGACPEAAEACRAAGIGFIPGVEIDSLFMGRSHHILGLGVDTEHPRLRAILEKNLGILLQMSTALISRMAAQYPGITPEDYAAYPDSDFRGGWKGLRYLKARGITARLEEGMPFYPAFGLHYTDMPFPSAGEVCAAVHEAGGTAILAHPGNNLPSNATDLHASLAALAAEGIDGVECYYPSHSPAFTAECLAFCGARELLVTGGSDDHGTFSRVVKGTEYSMEAFSAHMETVNLGKLTDREFA